MKFYIHKSYRQGFFENYQNSPTLSNNKILYIYFKKIYNILKLSIIYIFISKMSIFFCYKFSNL